MVVHFLGPFGQVTHVAVGATGMGRYEVRDELLVQAVLLVDAQEEVAELHEVFPRGFAHQSEYIRGRVLGSHLESTGHMAGDQLATVLLRHQVVSHARAHVRALNIR